MQPSVSLERGNGRTIYQPLFNVNDASSLTVYSYKICDASLGGETFVSAGYAWTMAF